MHGVIDGNQRALIVSLYDSLLSLLCHSQIDSFTSHPRAFDTKFCPGPRVARGGCKRINLTVTLYRVSTEAGKRAFFTILAGKAGLFKNI